MFNQKIKDLFNNAISALLEENALTIPCILKYQGSEKILCNNCIFDPISQRSANTYNGEGPSLFYDGQICPVCSGFGLLDSNNNKKINLGVIFNSKYFVNIGNTVNIPDGSIQTLCSTNLINSIRNASELSIVVSGKNYNYTRSSEPEPAGLGDTNFIFTMWKRQ
jgi:hypothetical protein